MNEPLETVGAAAYQNVFYRLLGPDYIADALDLAHESDPDATLFLNEWFSETLGPKFDAFLELVTRLVARGAPLHGVGFQGHFLQPPRFDDLRAHLQAFADLGLVVELTEVDIALRSASSPEAQLDQQRQDYFDVASACLAVATCRRITLWGFTDRFTWMDEFFGPGFAPLVLDRDYRRKPAYFGLRDALAQAGGRGGR